MSPWRATSSCSGEGRAIMIKVLVCDDSALIRALLSNIINRQPDMTVVGSAADALEAREDLDDFMRT